MCGDHATYNKLLSVWGVQHEPDHAFGGGAVHDRVRDRCGCGYKYHCGSTEMSWWELVGGVALVCSAGAILGGFGAFIQDRYMKR